MRKDLRFIPFPLKKVWMGGGPGCSALARVTASRLLDFLWLRPGRADFTTRPRPKNTPAVAAQSASFLGQFLWVPKPAISLPNRGISLPKLQIILGS